MYDIPYVENHVPSSLVTIFATMIKFPVENKNLTYEELPCSVDDRSRIYEIISLMGENGKISLLFKKGYIEDLGARIQHVHPLKFLSTIVVHPHLRACLDPIFDDYFKRNGFMDGIGPSLSREANNGKLDQYIGDFAKEVGVPEESISDYFRTRDWEGLVRFFII